MKTRRSLEMRDIVAPIVHVIQATGDPVTEYRMVFQEGAFIFETSVRGDDLTDFESDLLPLTGACIFPVPREPNTHNFANSNDFEIGTSDSTYHLCPNTGTRWILKRMEGKIDSGLTITSTDSFNMAIWGSYDNLTACPAWNGTRTAFGSPALNMETGTGWAESFYDEKQENKTYVYLDDWAKKYYVSHFEWKSVEDMKLKADCMDIGSFLQSLSFDYQKDRQFIQLRDSLNERMEFWIKNDVAYTATNGKPVKASGTFDEYPEI